MAFHLTLGVVFDLSLTPQPDAPLAGAPKFLEFFQGLLTRGASGLTINVNSWQTQRWVESGHHCLDSLQSMMRYGLVELTGTAAHHPILPLLHPIEARRQVVLNTTVQKRLLGDSWQPAGLFPPELAYGHELVPLLPGLGLRWCLSDDSNFSTLNGSVPFDWVPRVSELSVPLCSRLWSGVMRSPGNLEGERVVDELTASCASWFGEKPGYLIVAVPGRSLHKPGYFEFLWRFLNRVSQREDVSVAHVSQIVHRFPGQDCEVPPGSWKSTPDDFWNGDFFAPWNSPEQSKHQILWRVTELAWASLEKLREKLDLGMNSDNFEWVVHNAPPPSALANLLDVIGAGEPEQLDQARQWLRLLGA